MTKEFYNRVSDTPIYVTNAYHMFKIDQQRNRPVDMKRVDLLTKSISLENRLSINPIVIDKNYTVLKGQHRLEAAKRLLVPIYYFFSPISVSSLSLARDEAYTKSWVLSDYSSLAIERGDSNYIDFDKFYLENREYNNKEILTLSTAIFLCSTSYQMKALDTYRSGSYIADNIQNAEYVMRCCRDYYDLLPPELSDYPSQKLILSVRLFVNKEGYDHNHMLKKLKQRGVTIRKSPNTAMYLSQFEEIYNKNKRKSERD